MKNVTIGLGGVTGLAPEPINFTSSSVNTLTVLGGGGTNTYTVSATPRQHQRDAGHRRRH